MEFKHFLTHILAFQRLSTMLLSLRVPQAKDSPCVIVFGRPGAGKTTIAEAAVASFDEANSFCLGLDLDVCVPEWMRENFAKGIYPNLKQREDFAYCCCDYVERQIEENWKEGRVDMAVVISFSFVNTDLRDIFRSRFPRAKWILIDTSDEEATKRISEREGHFYKGELEEESMKKEPREGERNDVDNNEWKFAPVTFRHDVLDGKKPVAVNAQSVLRILRKAATL